MQDLCFVRPGHLEWREVAAPHIESASDALVRPVAVTLCDGDGAILRGDLPLVGPFSFGHEFVAEVVELGDGVAGFSPGNRVVLPVQISCGSCVRCGRGLTAHCKHVQQPASWGLGSFGGNWPGAFADRLRVPFAEHMMVPLPDGIDPISASSAGDNVSDGWRTVAPPLRESPGAEVLIVGAASIGLYAVEIACALGAGRVDYLDLDPGRRRIAEELGGHGLELPPQRRYPVVVDATMKPDGLRTALGAVDAGGICTAIFPGYETSVSFLDLWRRGVRFHTGVANARAHLPEVLSLMEKGAIHPRRVTTEVLEWPQAPDALGQPSMKPVFVRSGEIEL